MIQPGYFSMDAHDHISVMSKLKSKIDGTPVLVGQGKKNATLILDELKKSKKFLITKGLLDSVKVKGDDWKNRKTFMMPYRAISIEYEYLGDCGCIHPTVVLAFLKQDSLFVFGMSKQEKLWDPAPFYYEIDLNNLKAEGGPPFKAFLPEWCDELFKDKNDEEIKEGLLDGLRKSDWAGWALVSFLLIVNSKNVNLHTIPAPERLNKKRSLRGKQPLYSYKVLDIDLGNIKQPKKSKFITPKYHTRSHLCRGHFKRRESGIYWWNAHMRGQKELGFLDKDYRVVKS